MRITASQAKTCVGNICEEHEIGLRRSTAWGFGQDRTPSGMAGVSVMLTRPEALRKLEDAVEAEMEKGSGKMFGDVPYHVRFRRSQTVVPVTYPSMIVGLNRATVPESRLVEELEYLCDQLNALHGTEECLLQFSPGQFINKPVGTGSLVTALPSSIGLAEFIARQEVTGAPPYELAFAMNGNLLKSSQSVTTAEADAVLSKLEQVQAEVRTQGGGFADHRRDVGRAVDEMSTLNANFGTFGADLTTNLGRLFTNLKQAKDVDAAALIRSGSSLTHEMELRLIKMKLDVVDSQVLLLQRDRHVLQNE